MRHPVIERVERMFNSRQRWKSLWDMTYQYIAPDRAVFFQAAKDVNTVMDRVFDSTAIDGAERLVNLITSRLCPPWMKWFRLNPGAAVVDQRERDELRKPLQLVENLMFSALNRTNFYQELQPTVLDRVVGGTGAMGTGRTQGKRWFVNTPLSDIALEEDEKGEIRSVGRKYEIPTSELIRVYGPRLGEVWQMSHSQKPDEKHTVYELNSRDSLGDWTCTKVLDAAEGGTEIESETYPYPRLMATRWTKIPGEAYGRGPGLRALSDTRALNRLKELTLKHAARVTGGIYTVVDDGVINPYTIALEPLTFIPVASNSPAEPTIQGLPPAGDLQLGSLVAEDLRVSIQRIFLADQFGPLDRTPMSATEVIERTRIIAQELGATVSRMQQELLVPVLRVVLEDLKDDPGIALPTDLSLDDESFRVEFVSQLAQAQWAVEEQQITEFMMTAVQMGQVDPKAGLVLDTHKALRRIGEIKSVPADLLRSEAEVDQMLEQAGAVMGQAEQEGMPLGEQ